jgi:hypothetical protein
VQKAVKVLVDSGLREWLIQELMQEWANSANNPAQDQRLKDQLVLTHKLFERLTRAG